jgi:hypothetical protein
MNLSITPREKFMLAVLSTAPENTSFTPAQIQKLFFLIDREAAPLAGGPYFRFEPYDYGPFDKAVYDELDYLNRIGLIQVISGRYRLYALTHEGWTIGVSELPNYDLRAQQYFTACSEWVRSLNFEQLISAIYRKYPDMKEKSIFRA